MRQIEIRRLAPFLVKKMENTLKGKKLQMSQIFKDNGRVVPVTSVFVENLAQLLSPEHIGKNVVVVGTSKGKGFTGGMKKWGFHGEQATRGQSDKPRSNGAIGAQTPNRVFKGKKMSGRHGNKRVTIKGYTLTSIDFDKNILMVSGPVPGARNSEVLIKVL
mgnify:CR=1 FL=1